MNLSGRNTRLLSEGKGLCEDFQDRGSTRMASQAYSLLGVDKIETRVFDGREDGRYLWDSNIEDELRDDVPEQVLRDEWGNATGDGPKPRHGGHGSKGGALLPSTPLYKYLISVCPASRPG